MKLREHIDTFKRVFKKVVESCVKDADQELFQPARIAGRRLLSFGIPCHVPCIRAAPSWNEEVAHQVGTAVIPIVKRLTKADLSALYKGELEVDPRKPMVNQVIPWTKLTPPANFLPAAIKKRKAEQGGIDDATIYCKRSRKDEQFIISCATCGFARTVGHKSLSYDGEWSNLECDGCCKQRRANKWLCTHLVKWHRCPIHRDFGYAAGFGEVIPEPEDQEAERSNGGKNAK